MPTDPQVCFYIIDFAITSVGPYHEAAILLPITYKEVTVEQNGNDWVGTASANGEADLKASYTGECVRNDEFLWPDFINLTPIPSSASTSEAFLPPRTGRALRVPAEYLEPPKFHSLKGQVTLEINDELPWNGLVDETKPFPGLVSSYIGGVNLGNQPLD